MAKHNELGRIGETMARDFLLSKGWIIREQNWRMGNLEIDLVVEDPTTRVLHIVEVKTRTNLYHIELDKLVGAQKRRNLYNAATGYMRYYNLDMGLTFDIIVIEGNPASSPDTYKLHYIPRAFYPPVKTYRR